MKKDMLHKKPLLIRILILSSLLVISFFIIDNELNKIKNGVIRERHAFRQKFMKVDKEEIIFRDNVAYELISAGESWKFMDDGKNPGSGWHSDFFNDDHWKIGDDGFGPESDEEARILNYRSMAKMPVTTYFRKRFFVPDTLDVDVLELSLIRDDGAVVYLNGQEVFRNNMPEGAVKHNTLASKEVSGKEESTYIVAEISASELKVGENTIAVEIHQNKRSDADINFNLKLKSNPEKAGYTFAVIGCFGRSGSAESAVASLVKSWGPSFIVTAGDNNYPDGSSSTIDRNIGKYFQSYIYPYKGDFGSGASYNKFFPCLGNHDLTSSGGSPYYNYFSLPNNERYYDFVKGDVHFFMLNSNKSEPKGTSSSSAQASWLKNKLQSSSAKWKIVVFHHPAYASSLPSSGTYMRWPFKSWGADAVITAHAHVYERIIRDGFVYFVNGIGGASKGSFTTTVSGSKKKYNSNYGAMKVVVGSSSIVFKFYNINNSLIDSYTLSSSKNAEENCQVKIYSEGSPSICEGGNVVLFTESDGRFSYQWLWNGTEIPGATSTRFSAKTSGSYQLRKSSVECTDLSDPIVVKVLTCPQPDTVTVLNADSLDLSGNTSFPIHISPNPNNGKFSLDFCLEKRNRETVDLAVINSSGIIIYTQQPVINDGCVNETIELDNNLDRGLYILQIKAGRKVENVKLMLNK